MKSTIILVELNIYNSKKEGSQEDNRFCGTQKDRLKA